MITEVDRDFTIMTTTFEVCYVDSPHFYKDTVTFNVHWSDGTYSREPMKHIIPGCEFLVEKWIDENCSIVTEKLIAEILKAFN